MFSCNVKPCVCASLKCYDGEEDELIEKTCAPGFICAKSVSDGENHRKRMIYLLKYLGKRGCLPRISDIGIGCGNLPASTGLTGEFCFCDTEL